MLDEITTKRFKNVLQKYGNFFLYQLIKNKNLISKDDEMVIEKKISRDIFSLNFFFHFQNPMK